MSNYTYMVTNNINGKVYVGSHSWDGNGMDPNYYGSGTAITRAVKKYGKENFQVEVLYFYDTVEECRQDEERILTEYNVRDCPHSYNCKNSAIGFTSDDMTDEIRQKLSRAMKGKNNPMYGKHPTLSEEHRNKISQALRGENNPMYGKTHTENTRKKMSQARKGEKHPMYGRTGENNPMYGRTRTENTRTKIAIANGGKPFVAIKDGKIKIFTSQMECSRVLGIHQSAINECLKGKRKSTGGYTFKYTEQLESGIYEGFTGIAE